MRVDAGTCLTPLEHSSRSLPEPTLATQTRNRNRRRELAGGIGLRVVLTGYSQGTHGVPELAGGIGLRVRRLPMKMVDVPQAKKDRDLAQSRDRKALSLLIELHALERDDLVGEAVVRLTHHT